MHTTWIVAADGSRARIFEMLDTDKSLQEIEDLANPTGHAHKRDLSPDSDGRFYGKGERHQAHTVPSRGDVHEHELELFSRTIGDFLDKACNEHRYDSLCLIAGPKFLGMLRANLGKETQKLVEEELPKDVTRFDADDIRALIEPLSRH
ncbi:MAG TPA: host attachment protein [Paucimonas sp.]|nr:host attachment protein [Paucimonas sp.]